MPRLAGLRSAWRRLFTERVALAVAARVVVLLEQRLQGSLDALERRLGEAVAAASEPRHGQLADRLDQMRAELRTIAGQVAELLAVAEPAGAGRARMVREAPGGQAVIDLFASEWSSRLPAESGLVSGGHAALFDDARIAWLDHHLGPIEGFTVLELGPLEGGHSFSLHRLGASSITAVEANSRAFLRLLCVKELFGLARLRPLLGSFMPFLAGSDGQRYDLVVASGVLYHMTEPLMLLDLICNVTDRVFLWTHYYDPEVVAAGLDAPLFGPPELQTQGGFSCIGSRRNYPDAALAWAGFNGGANRHATWLTRDGIVDYLRSRGMTRIEVGFDHATHQNGPALAIAASRG